VKLVNDGYSQPYVSSATRALPDWANWRGEVFSFTFEPAVIVYNSALVPEVEAPWSRDDIIRLLRGNMEKYRRRVATYDVNARRVSRSNAAFYPNHVGCYPAYQPPRPCARTKINIAAQLTVYSAKDVSNPDTWRTQTDSYSREAGVIDSVTRAPSRSTTIGTVCPILSRSRAAVNS
jgi:hypothetical protein